MTNADRADHAHTKPGVIRHSILGVTALAVAALDFTIGTKPMITVGIIALTTSVYSFLRAAALRRQLIPGITTMTDENGKAPMPDEAVFWLERRIEGPGGQVSTAERQLWINDYPSAVNALGSMCHSITFWRQPSYRLRLTLRGSQLANITRIDTVLGDRGWTRVPSDPPASIDQWPPETGITPS